MMMYLFLICGLDLVLGETAVWFEIFSARSEVPPWQRCKMNSCDWRGGGWPGLAPFLVREHLQGQEGHINTETSGSRMPRN